MKPFTELVGIGVPLPMANVDTDKIIPARFMKTIMRTGLGKNLFDSLRYENGQERPDFILNQEPYRSAEILITHENFGCGSSREHAPWALLDFGIRCVIAPDFADIFHENCFKNGILLVRLPRDICDLLMEDARMGGNARIGVDLNEQVVRRPNGESIPFVIDPVKRDHLLNGIDEISATMEKTKIIESFEESREAAREITCPAIEIENQSGVCLVP